MRTDRQTKERAAVKNFFVWLGVCFCLIMILGLTPKTEHAMGILGVIAFVVWCIVGFVWALRGFYRIITKPKGPKGF